jgi:hypothetical protein
MPPPHRFINFLFEVFGEFTKNDASPKVLELQIDLEVRRGLCNLIFLTVYKGVFTFFHHPELLL